MIPALINPMQGSVGATAAPATPPSFVNGGIIAESTSPSTGTLPGSRVTGNLLVLYFKSRNTANDPSVSAGWTQLDTFGFGGASQRFGVYYCFVTGSETAPVITCAGGGAIVSVVAQYSGTSASIAVVAGSKNGGTGTAITTAAITSSVNAILAVSASWDDTSTSPTQPAGFNNEGTGIFQNVFGSLRLCDITIATAGSSSPSVSCTGGNSPWGAFLFEMRPLGAGTTFNPSDESANVTLSNGNLTATYTSASDGGVRSITSKTTGKYYVEFTKGSPFNGGDSGLGIALLSANLATIGVVGAGGFVTFPSGSIYFNGSNTGLSLGATATIIGMAIDLDNQKGWFIGDSGTWNGNGSDNPATNTGGVNIAAIFPGAGAFLVCCSNQNTSSATLNVGDSAFVKAVPSGFTAGWPA